MTPSTDPDVRNYRIRLLPQVMTRGGAAAWPPHVLAPALWTRRSGTESGARFAGRVPLGQSPSLHRLRRRLPGLVRRLHRYYETVRLPGFVHRRRASLDFPTRPAACAAAGEPRTSRFSCEVFPYVHGVSDRARPVCISRWRCSRCGLPPCPTASASRRSALSRLNTRPARTPVNTSALPLPETPHDSGPLWVASPSTCDSFIHDTPPVYPGAFGTPALLAENRCLRRFGPTFVPASARTDPIRKS